MDGNLCGRDLPKTLLHGHEVRSHRVRRPRRHHAHGLALYDGEVSGTSTSSHQAETPPETCPSAHLKRKDGSLSPSPTFAGPSLQPQQLVCVLASAAFLPLAKTRSSFRTSSPPTARHTDEHNATSRHKPSTHLDTSHTSRPASTTSRPDSQTSQHKPLLALIQSQHTPARPPVEVAPLSSGRRGLPWLLPRCSVRLDH